MGTKITLLYGCDLHYLDHLAPLSNTYHIPLVTVDETIWHLCERFYPEVSCHLFDPLDIHTYLIENVTEVIYCFTKTHFDTYFGLTQNLANKKISTIWAPHGYSDKDNLQMIQNEKEIISYGPALEKKIIKYAPDATFHRIGNYRLDYYHKYHSFYQKLVDEELRRLADQPTFLFAPTWDDYEGVSSHGLLEEIGHNLPDSFNLIVKLHPNTCQLLDLKIERLKGRLAKENLLFIDHLPFIYPILDKIDGFIGDRSSIGYDFLFFDRPSFFLLDKDEPLLPLHKTGRVITDYKMLFSIIEQNINSDKKRYAPMRKKLYQEVFSS